MKNITFTLLLLFTCIQLGHSQSIFPVNGFCIAAPTEEKIDDFTTFIDKELGPQGINTLILRIDFNYAYKSRPELQDPNPLSEKSIKKLVAICKKHKIELIPQVNLLGHQSWANKLNKLLEVYPEFDETPHVKIPEEHQWPNEDGLYCKSYCPQHPEVHEVVFDLIDEIMAVCEAKSFHAGMDEVFYLADSKCPRCQGMDPASLFAGEVNKISAHLEMQDKRLWIWGDRLINAVNTGIGMWEASANNTSRAIDMISKSVVICDWHYNKAIPTPAYFALKGLDVIACSWNKGEVAQEQVKMMHSMRQNSTPAMKKHLLGVMHTVWSPAESFMDSYYGLKTNTRDKQGDQARCFSAMVEAINSLELKK